MNIESPETTAKIRKSPSREGTLRATRAPRHEGVPFRLRERDSEAGFREIHVEGELDLAVAERLGAAIERAERLPATLIDLSRCTFIDVTATTLIRAAHRRVGGEGRLLAIRGAGGQTLRLLTALGLTGDGLLCEPLGREAPA
jgi:anti-anti-sigma regulatory factor